ncbi:MULTISPECIES: flavodoxin family protein [Romboutsia]|uniref:flavodoxin family protein n=1 Tax=Romboutsia TaxID=1501226 RepID=UPI0021718E5F|nr:MULTISPECIES: NAD(P)H-dependent oxidoreductase [Romboutsia]MCI9260724.1 NAD(P)H-dependent oxidoreductase [Romboutsia sp.]
MNILIIHGSPRRGNTWNIVNRVKEKINEKIDVDYEIIELSKMKIPMCTGCFNCILKSEEKCPHYESIKYINNKIDWCDAMIITSPVYSLQVSGQLKNFIDHMSYNFHRPKYFNKKALIITTTAGVNAKEISNYIKEVLTFWGINTTYKLPIVYRNDNLEKYDKQIDKVLSEFIDTLKNNTFKSPTFKTIASYNVFRSMSINLYTKGNPDYDYWKNSELYKYPYHPDIKIGMIKSIFGNTLYKVVSKRMKNNKDMKYNERKIRIIKRLPKEEGINL